MVFLLKGIKKRINTIADLRNLWINFKYATWVRILSNYFLRKYGNSYILNSRVELKSIHIKYRSRLIDAVRKPHYFIHIKDY